MSRVRINSPGVPMLGYDLLRKLLIEPLLSRLWMLDRDISIRLGVIFPSRLPLFLGWAGGGGLGNSDLVELGGQL